MIKAITFDLDGVYFPEEGKKGFHKRLTELVGDESKVVHALYKSPEMLKLVTDELSEIEFTDWLNSYLGTEFTVDSLGEFWTRDYSINDEVSRYIKSARTAGYICCTCSNNNRIRVSALQNKFNFLDEFDVKIFSYEYNAVKPEAKIYRALLEEAGVAADELVYSDDNPARLDGAIQLGINTFVYENFQQFQTELSKLKVEVI
ncbi:HAD-IA family hydrolase [Candidatus Dojkabacteria bacterium]|uniref:HAD-IA family hydrolase n=1 Tax=Candidatus Dojkabacteria bacterium TaxID=2099670 RepID=A0A955L634_9BACT|nr:HAD-IA family hydrolase [Candidatus Dojkabacteria bacterium]